jgi:uncharacterized protein involved in exopolysaccharide biosynthesis
MNRRALQWAARLYPAPWRRRYGAEFSALLEESGGGWRALADVLKGALTMRMRSGSPWKFVAACGLLGAVVAGAAAWRLPKKYVSTAVLCIDADYSLPGGPVQERARLNQMEQDVLQRTALTSLIVSNGLYRADRAARPLENIVADMRAHDIAIRPIRRQLAKGQPAVVFSVSFTAESPAQAQQVTRGLAAQFIQRGKDAGAPQLEVLDPPSLPERPIQATSRWIPLGALLGIVVGLIAAGIRRWPIVATAGLAGASLAFALVSLLPKDYVSTAVLMGESVRNPQPVLSDAVLLRAIADPALNLYPGGRANNTPAALAARMRRDLTIRAIKPPADTIPLPHPVAAISFTYPDRYKAQAVTRFVVQEMTGSGVVILDPPSYPIQPSKPRLAPWGALGLILGLLAGIAITRRRRRDSAVAMA